MAEKDVISLIHSLTKEQDQRLLSAIYKRVKSRELAKDCLQEAYRLALENPESIKNPERLFGWLFVVAQRVAMECINRRHIWEKVINLHGTQSSSDPYESVILRLSVNKEIDRSIKKWSKLKRNVFYLYFVKGMKLNKISEFLGISPSNARQIKHRILQELKRKRNLFE